MKKIFVYIASAALMFAVSCNKEEVNVDTTAPVETELITVDLNPMTKTALGVEGTTTWDADDKVSVTVGGEVVGTLSLVEGSTFSGEITAGLSGAAVLNYPAGVTTVPTPQTAVAGSFADEAALLEGTTTVEDLRAGTGVELKNKTALLMFTVAQAGDVTFEVGSTKYTVTGCKTGNTYYACVTPASDVTFVARIGGYLSKQAPKNVTFTANKIADLGNLPAPKASTWTIKGAFNSWKEGYTMYVEGEYYVARNVNLSKKSEFKFETSGNYYRTIGWNPEMGKWMGLYKFDANPSLDAGTYDIYVNSSLYQACVVKSGTTMPVLNVNNSQYYIVMRHNWNDWDYRLHCYNGATWATGWPGPYCEGSFNYDNSEYKYWAVGTNDNGKTISLLFNDDNNNSIQETYGWDNLKLNTDHFWEMDSWNNNDKKASIKKLDVSKFR